MPIRLYRDPNSDAGGAASAASSTGAAAASTPAGGGGQAPASPGDNPMMSFAEGLAKSLQKASTPSLPADGGKKTEGPASPSEGEGGGDDDKSKDPGTTADDSLEAGELEEQEGAEPKEGWSKEELKTLEAMKADLPFSESSRSVLKSLRETRAQLDRVSASNTNAISRTQSLEAALYSGDAKALQEMGYDLKLDQRTHEDHMKELEGQFNSLAGAFKPLLTSLKDSHPEAARAVQAAVQKILDGINDKAATITREKEWQERESKILEKAGVKSGTPNSYKEFSKKAENNLAALAQEDPEAAKYFKFIESETKPGGGLHALGLNLARAYGTSLEAARTMNRVAKGLYFEQNMKSILADRRKAWEKDRMKRSPTEKVTGSDRAPAATPNGVHSHIAGGMRAFMGQPS